MAETTSNVLNKIASTVLGGGDSAVSHSSAALTMAGAALAGSAALFYYLNSATKSLTNNLIDFKNQTRPHKTIEGAYISTISKTDKLLSFYYQDGQTLYENFRKGEKVSNDGPHLGWKPSRNEPYKWLKYSEVNKMAEELGSAFLDFGLQSGKEDLVGIYAKNRPEWVITETACNAYSLVTVPLYETLGVEAISFILMQSQLRVVVCDDSEKALQLMNFPSSLECIVVIESLSDAAVARAAELNVRLHTLEESRALGRLSAKPVAPPRPEDVATICYTSGTTGAPKGAIITHGNLIAVVATCLVYLRDTKLITDGAEVYLSYLPLAHMFERAAQALLVAIGGRIGFYQGDIRLLLDDVRELRPTIFCTVPRLLNRIYARINAGLEHAPAYKRALFRWAFAQKEREVARGIARNNSVYDMFFKAIRASLGGRCKLMLTGSAPVSPEVLHFMRVVSGCCVIEGYGATETSGACGVQVPGERTVGHVGPPFLCCTYRLRDVPEMGLVVARDGRGEILVAGKNIFKGYYKDEEKTREALDADGWYHTGDIGALDEHGCLRIVDRVKNIFKLQQGEYIAPEKIENIYVRSKYVAQVFVYGNSLKSSLVAVVVPEETELFELAEHKGFKKDLKELCHNTQVKNAVLKDMNQLGKEGDLKGFEQARFIHLHHELFSIENGLLTPTMKSKRNELAKYFKAEIEHLYQNAD